MPMLVPTPEEAARMPWHARQKASHRARQAERETARLVGAQWGAQQRAKAEAALAALDPDPDAEAHRIALLEALS